MFNSVLKIGMLILMAMSTKSQADDQSSRQIDATGNSGSRLVAKQKEQFQGAVKPLAQNAFTMSVAQGRISVAVDKVPLGMVLQELARQTDIRIYLSASIAAERITKHFTNKPLPKGIKQLLSGQSYALTYDANKDAQRLAIRPPSKQGAITTAMRIVELRLVSGSGSILDLQNTNLHSILGQKKYSNSDLATLKAKLVEAMTASDTFALNELMYQVSEFPDRDAALQAFKEANKEHLANRGKRAVDNGDAQVNSLKASDQTTVSDTNNFAIEFETKALEGLQANDSDSTSRLNELMNLALHDPIALQALSLAHAKLAAGKDRPRLKK